MNNFGWLSIARIGLVQAALGAMVVLTTSTLNRVMVVELALPAMLPGFLVALHYMMQLARPRMGFGSDVGGKHTPWIIGGMAVLAGGGVLASVATAWMGSNRPAGIALAVFAFAVIGLGVSASGTSLLVMLAKRVDAGKRAAAATLVWMMMIFGFAVTAGVAGKLLDPYSPERLVGVTAAVCALAFVVALLAVYKLEGTALPLEKVETTASPPAPGKLLFGQALREVWAEPAARQFTIFVFVSMLAFSAQDLILEPFAGTVFGLTPGQTTQLSGLQHGGVLAGMILVALAGLVAARWNRHPVLRHVGSLRSWTVGGCLASALALASLSAAGMAGPGWPLLATVFCLGLANGAFSIGAISSMMRLAGQGRQGREGVRMGLWGAAQAVAFGMGGFMGTVASDVARWLIASPGAAYASVFGLEALLFVVAAVLAWRVGNVKASPVPNALRPASTARIPAAMIFASDVAK